MTQVEGPLEVLDAATKSTVRVTLDSDSADLTAGGDQRNGDLRLKDSDGNNRITLGSETDRRQNGWGSPPVSLCKCGVCGSGMLREPGWSDWARVPICPWEARAMTELSG